MKTHHIIAIGLVIGIIYLLTRNKAVQQATGIVVGDDDNMTVTSIPGNSSLIPNATAGSTAFPSVLQ